MALQTIQHKTQANWLEKHDFYDFSSARYSCILHFWARQRPTRVLHHIWKILPVQRELSFATKLGDSLCTRVWRFHGDGDLHGIKFGWYNSGPARKYGTERNVMMDVYIFLTAWKRLCQAIIQLLSYPSKDLLVFVCKNCPEMETTTSQAQSQLPPNTSWELISTIYNKFLSNKHNDARCFSPLNKSADFCWGVHMSVCKSTGGGGGGRCFCSDRQGSALQARVSLD